ncbi:uncharacterized protein [Panulirus ornatus]|uniref:uncharacterized protein isoform X2 n=1 Tax=Panulirus ornatus TaxID=150431 RepID=UPI003A877EEC
MSKLFPMFKRKGKGKDEEAEDDTKKKHGKGGKLSKEEHHGPSPRATAVSSRSDRKRKEKVVKRKAPTPNGKENRPLEAGLDRHHHKGDFYVDDTGTVREGPHTKMVVDDVPASEEDHEANLVGNPQLECKQEDSGITDHENTIVTGSKDTAKGSLRDEDASEIVGDRDHLQDSHKGYPQEVDLEDESSGYDYSEPCNEEQETTEKGILFDRCVRHEEQVQDCVQSKSSIITERMSQEVMAGEFTCKASHVITEDAQLVSNDCHANESPQTEVETCQGKQEEILAVSKPPGSAQIKEEISPEASDGHEFMTGQSSRTDVDKDEDRLDESLDGTVDDGGKMEEEGTSDVSVGSDDVSMREEKSESVDGMTDTQFVSIIDSQNMLSSQDSDDDFDSAQEDWDEEDDMGQSPVNRSLQESVKNTTHESIFDEVNEAANNVLISKKCEENEVPDLQREPSRSSSVYQDAPLIFEDTDIVSIASIIDASNEECTKGPSEQESGRKTRGPPGRLTRKTSNVSTASSELFNEELDELLDEELDRLSEEEVENVKFKASSLDRVDAKASESTVTVDVVDNALQGKSFGVGIINTLDTTKQGSENILPTADVGIEVSDPNGVTREVCENGQDVPSNQSKGGLLQKAPDSCTVVSEECRIGVKESLTTSPMVLPSEEVIDQAKDSGYYSLPVSPKPVVAVRGVEASREEVGRVADDSFGDSEEEGMLTPPTEVAALPPFPEELGTAGKESVVKESVLDSSIADESALLYQSCCESHETEQTKDINKLEGTVIVTEEEGAGKGVSTESQIASKSKKHELDIPKDTATEFRESATSPKGGGSGGASSSTPTGRHSRHKSPLLDLENKQNGDEPLRSPDPVGDRFLQHAVCLSHEEAEARLAQRRAARAEARELRLRELEKQQQDQDNDEEKQFTSPSFAEPSPRPAGAGRTPVRTAGINCTGQYSRRSSEDSTTDESLPANVREMRAELKELDEKFRKAMITNAQLDNEKATLTYEVELMKDRYTELEEVHTQLTKEHRKKCTEYEQLRKVSTKLQEEVKILRGLLQERDQLIQEYGLVVVGEDEENIEEVESEKEDDDMDDLTPRKIAVKKALLSQEAAELLEKGAAKGSLDIRLKKFGEEKNDLEDQVRRLKLELEEERNKNRRRENGLDYEKQKEQNKTVNEYKFRVQKAEAEVSTLQANVARLDALSARYKTQSEELERSEEELKLEKRKLQRELRDAQSRLEELETTNNHLIKRFDKLKNARSTLLKDLSLDPV